MGPTITLGDLSRRLDCTLVGGDPSVPIRGVSTLERAGEGEVTFLANLKYAPKVKTSRAAAIIAGEPLKDLHSATLVSKNPYYDFARALGFFYHPPKPDPGIHPTAAVDPSARIGHGASIGAYVVVGPDTTIGANAAIYPHVVIYQGCHIGDDFTAHSHAAVREFTQIGNRVVLQNGVVVGGDGFGFAKANDGTQYKIVQSGVTVIEDDVEIQSLTSVDRATMGETRVKRGARIDSLVQIGHACVVGEDNIICAQTGLAGSTVLEKNVLLAGQVGVSGHLTIHENAIVYAQRGVGGDVPAGARISGSPAFDSREWLRAVSAFPKLAEMQRLLRQ